MAFSTIECLSCGVSFNQKAGAGRPRLRCEGCRPGKRTEPRLCVGCGAELEGRTRLRCRACFSEKERRRLKARDAAITAAKRAARPPKPPRQPRDYRQERIDAAARAGRTAPRARSELTAERLRKERAREVRRLRKQALYRKDRPWLAPGLTQAERWKVRHRCDPSFAISNRVKASFQRKVRKSRFGDMIRAALQRGGEAPSVTAFLGYTVEDVRRHIERQFSRKMSWAAFLRGEIHIDHIRPLSKFNLNDPAELKAAWALSNLRPLWADENRKKHAKLLLLL